MAERCDFADGWQHCDLAAGHDGLHEDHWLGGNPTSPKTPDPPRMNGSTAIASGNVPSSTLQSTAPEAVHWVGDAPTSLHGNGAASFNRTTRERARVTCGLCRTLLARSELTESGGSDA